MELCDPEIGDFAVFHDGFPGSDTYYGICIDVCEGMALVRHKNGGQYWINEWIALRSKSELHGCYKIDLPRDKFAAINEERDRIFGHDESE